ncbi:phage portal protein family protein [Haliangium sp.]|uniref:phage portal protein family protein n=1 Tax=Haliangium sp. TaxID=2663208 RepID=UPI003D0FCB75
MPRRRRRNRRARQHDLAGHRITADEISALARALDRQQKGVGSGNQVSHAGWDLTPERIVAAFQAAEAGAPAQQFDIFDDVVERDLTLGGLVESRTDALAGKHVVIQAGADDADSRAAADAFRAEVWARIDWRDLIRHHQYSSNLYGFAGTELDWTYDPELRRVTVGGYWHARARDFVVATLYHPRVAGAEPDELLIRQSLQDLTGQRLIPGKWVVTRRTHSVPVARAGLGRGSTWWSHIKMVGVADWLVFVRRFGLPFVLATIKDWTNLQERAAAEEILRRIGDDGGAIVAENSIVGVEFKDGVANSRNANGDLHGRLATAANNELAKRWNGATLSSESGGGASSYALAKEHGGIRFELLQADAMRISESLERQLAEPWMRLNGIAGATPRIRFHLVRIADPMAYANTASIAVNQLGIRISKAQTLEALGMREAESPDDAVTGMAAGAAPQKQGERDDG